MRFYSLSSNPNKPCSVVQFKGCSLMLDCGLDLSPLLSFLPLPVVTAKVPATNTPSSTPQTNISSSKVWVSPGLETGCELREAGAGGTGCVLVDSQPEVLPPQAGVLPWEDLDCILVSNYTCMLALPYITEHTGFKGKVYATEPSLLLGKIFMEELLEYVGRSPRHHKATKWKSVADKLPPPLCDLGDKLNSLQTLYSTQDMLSSLTKVQMLGFNEAASVFGLLSVKPVSSGYCLGSCNWVIRGAESQEKIVYLAASSTLTTHPKGMDQESLKGADCLILTGLTQTPTHAPDPVLADFCRIVCDTLKSSGNVLVPCYPSGIIYDLFECLSNQMDMNGLTTVPLFFFSPVAASSLAYSNIMAEWLSSGKHNRVYVPEEPFVHGALARGGRLKSFQSIASEGVHSEYRQPCVVFCGHPSLRMGDAVHFLEMWGNNPANLVVFTEPSFNHVQALAPFQPLAMKSVHCPIDTSLNFSQAKKLLREARPKCLVVPAKYKEPPPSAPTRLDLVLDVLPEVPVLLHHSKLDTLKVPVVRSGERIQLTPALAATIKPVEVKPGIAVATLSGSLTVKDNRYTLGLIEENSSSSRKRPSPSPQGLSVPLSKQKPAHYLYGSLNASEFVAKLNTRGIVDAKVETGRDGGFPIQIHLPAEDSLIQVMSDETHVLYEQGEGGEAGHTERLREVLKESILSCVTKF